MKAGSGKQLVVQAREAFATRDPGRVRAVFEQTPSGSRRRATPPPWPSTALTISSGVTASCSS